MSTTVHEALMNADLNFNNVKSMFGSNPFFEIAHNQLKNALQAIDGGMSLNDVIQEGVGGDLKLSK